MKVFFLCRTGHHTSLLAAGLYLGYVNKNASIIDVFQLKGYDSFEFKDVGVPFFVGKDGSDNEVYTIGVASQSALLSRVVGDLLNLITESSEEWRVLNFVDCVSRFTRMGLFFKRIGLNRLAALMFSYGIKRELALLDNKLEMKLERALMI